MSPNLVDMYQKPVSRGSTNQLDSEDEEMDIRKILKDIERLGYSSMTWKERKAVDNRNIVALGGKPPKKHRTPLSVAKPAMKNQKKREQKQMEEGRIFGRFLNNAAGKKREVQRKLEDRGLKATEGHFRKGVLDVKHLLQPNPPPKNNDGPRERISKGKKKGKGKGKDKGKGKGKKDKRRGR